MRVNNWCETAVYRYVNGDTLRGTRQKPQKIMKGDIIHRHVACMSMRYWLMSSSMRMQLPASLLVHSQPAGCRIYQHSRNQLDVLRCFSTVYPRIRQFQTFPDNLRQGGYVIVVLCLSVCLLATVRKNFRADLHEIFRKVSNCSINKLLNFGGDPVTVYRDCFPDSSLLGDTESG